MMMDDLFKDIDKFINNPLPIGFLKASGTVKCAICGHKHKRRVKVAVYDLKKQEEAKEEALKRLQKDYTCKICKTISKVKHND